MALSLAANAWPASLTRVWQFAAGVTGNLSKEVATSVLDTGGKLVLVSMTPEDTLPPVSLTVVHYCQDIQKSSEH